MRSTEVLNDLLDDLTRQQLTELLQWLWSNRYMATRAAMKQWRADNGLPTGD